MSHSPFAYSITPSACASNNCGTVSPSSLAVFHLDDELEPARLIERDVARVRAFEDLSDVGAAPVEIRPVHAAGHRQPARIGEPAPWAPLGSAT
jgi:hypothetical protein